MTIGQLATAAGVHVETVRYYQRRGLLEVPPREAGRIARYADDALKRLRFIRRAQALGFSLEDAGNLLALADDRACAVARGLGERKLADVREQLHRLRALEAGLAELVARCSRSTEARRCPLIDALNG
jgi:MerR family mercuric resistance operon transcriptional regulator